MSYSLLFNAGRIEGETHQRYIDGKDNSDITDTGFKYYCGKLYELIKHFWSLDLVVPEYITFGNTTFKNGRREFEFVSVKLPNPRDIFYMIACTLISEYERTRQINYGLFAFANYIVSGYYDCNKDSDFLTNDFILTQPESFSTSEAFINTANTYYSEFVPFFGSRCLYGIKTFLDMLIYNKKFYIGNGTNCILPHGTTFETSNDVTRHDIEHYNQYTKKNITMIDENFLRLLYDKILSVNPIGDRQIILYILFFILHEDTFDGNFTNGLLLSVIDGVISTIQDSIIEIFNPMFDYDKTPQIMSKSLNKLIKDIKVDTSTIDIYSTETILDSLPINPQQRLEMIHKASKCPEIDLLVSIIFRGWNMLLQLHKEVLAGF